MLEGLCRSYAANRLPFDPLQFPRRYARPCDREIAGLLAATLAYGNARSVCASVGTVLAALGSAPAETLGRLGPDGLRAALRGFRHRWTRGADVAVLLWRVAQALEEHGSLRAIFLGGYEPADRNLGPSLTRFVDAILACDPRPLRSRGAELPGTGARYLLPRPADGSACKRLNMFARWMVRPDDGLDLGLWPEVSRAKLVMPLDTHTARVARGLGLTARATTDWRAAEEVTEALKRFDPDDPVRFDFALCHASMSGDWQAPSEEPRRRALCVPRTRRARRLP